MKNTLIKSIALLTSVMFVMTVCPPDLWAKSKRKKKPTTGVIRILSTSIGAEIRINGEMLARVPYEEDITLPAGVHDLEVFLRGYMRHQEQVTVMAGSEEELEIDLIAVEGVVIIETGDIMDATIEVDGQIIGSTPFDGLIPAGTHTLRVYAPGYMDTIREVRIQAGKRYVLDFDLIAEPAPVVAVAPVVKDSSPEFYQTWWFWTLTGVAVAGTAAGVAVGAQSPEATNAPFNHVITLPPLGPTR